MSCLVLSLYLKYHLDRNNNFLSNQTLFLLTEFWVSFENFKTILNIKKPTKMEKTFPLVFAQKYLKLFLLFGCPADTFDIHSSLVAYGMIQQQFVLILTITYS